MQFQLRVPEGFRGRIYTHKVTSQSLAKLTFPIADSITGGHSALFAGTEATRTHSVFLESVASLIVELKRYVLSSLQSPCFGQRNPRLVVIANSNMLSSEIAISFTLIAHFLHCPSRKD